MEPIVSEIEAGGYSIDDGIAKISLVGAGMKSHPGVAADMFQALADEGVNIEMISTSSIRVSCVVRAEDAERAVRAVHLHFRLGEPGTLRQD
jgi:aspartate kinase